MTSTARDRILRAAFLAFSRRGVDGATTREIARLAQVNEVTLFRNFQSKEQLLREVVAEISRRYGQVFAGGSVETQAQLRRTVRDYAEAYVISLRENEDFVRMFLGEMHRHRQLCQRLFGKSIKAVRFRFLAVLESAREKGLVRRDLDLLTAVDAFTGMLLAGVLRGPITKTQYPRERYCQSCVKLFIRGIEP